MSVPPRAARYGFADLVRPTGLLLGLLWLAIALVLNQEHEAALTLADRDQALMLWCAVAYWTLAIGALATILALIAARWAASILDRRDAEARRLEATRRKLIDTVEATSDIYFELGPDLAITEVAPRICELTGLQPSDIIGLKTSALRAFENTGTTSFEDAVGQRRPFRNIDLPIALPDGRQYWIRMSGVPTFDEGGQFQGYRCMASDITESEIDKARQLHQDRMSALGQLAGGVAHDFNNLLTSIIGFAALLEEDLRGDPSTRRLAERILHSGNRAKQLVERILAFARRSSVTPELVDVGDAVAELLPILRASLPASSRIESAIETRAETVLIAPSQLSQLLVALCTNANEALAGRDGTIGLCLVPTPADCPIYRRLAASRLSNAERISIVALPTGAYQVLLGQLNTAQTHVRLTVTDDGPGIAFNLLGRVFEPYFTTKPAGKGAGLGLSVVHGVVLEANGALALTTSESLGTRVDVFFPVLQRDAPPRAETAAQQPEAPPHVLLVDDEPDVLELQRLTLLRAGFIVHPCHDALAAWNAFEADPGAWQLVVTDQGMPNMRGVELIRRVKERRPEIACVLYTGAGDSMTEDSARAAGADVVLRKPVLPAVLQMEISRLVSGRRAA